MRVLKLSMVVFFSMIILFSCSNDSNETLIDNENISTVDLSINRSNNQTTESQQNEQEGLLSIYQSMAEMHNEGLDYILNRLKQDVNNGFDVNNMEETISRIKEYTIQYIMNNDLIHDVDIEVLRKDVNRSVDLTLRNENYNHIYFSRDNDYLTINQKMELDAVSESINPNDLDVTLERINDIKRNWIENHLNDSEYRIPFIATDVTTQSMIYWSTNLDDWRDLDEDPIPSAIDWGTIGKADATGAVGGAIRGIGAGTTGLMFGPGGAVLGFAGSVLGGALASSAIAGGLFSWW